LIPLLKECALAWNLREFRQETRANCAHAMVISLQRYWKLKEAQRLAPVPRYDEELLCANWNPAVQLLLQSSCQTEQESSSQLTNNASAIDADTFLDRVYALATHA
jgi:hypothetical protein